MTSEWFWAKVDKRGADDCWEWLGGLTHNGYGDTGRLNGERRAHRIAYSLTYGAIPVALCVCHICDNPICCNPAHLWVGTRADNNRDMMIKGRHVASMGDRNGMRRHPGSRLVGERQPTAKLTWKDVDIIRQAHANGTASSTLAETYRVHRSTIHLIVRHRIWKEAFK